MKEPNAVMTGLKPSDIFRGGKMILTCTICDEAKNNMTCCCTHQMNMFLNISKGTIAWLHLPWFVALRDEVGL